MKLVRLLVAFFLCVPVFAGAQSPDPTVLERTIQTDVAHARLSAEVEKLSAEVSRLRSGSSSAPVDPVILDRLNELKDELATMPTIEELRTLREAVDTLQRKVDTQAAAITQVSSSMGEQIATVQEAMSKNSNRSSSGVDILARQATALAVCLAVLAMVIGILARLTARKSRVATRDVAEELETVRRTQRGQAHDISELKRRVEPVVFPSDFDAEVKALTGDERYKPVIELDGEKYVVEFRVAEDSPGMLRVSGISGHHNPIQRKNARGVVARAAMNFRLTQRHKAENSSGGDNIVAIGTIKKS